MVGQPKSMIPASVGGGSIEITAAEAQKSVLITNFHN